MKKKILIIDDDEEICEELSEMLRTEGYHVETVSDGLVARTLIEKKPFHLLLLDLKIPTVTGIELVEFIRKKRLLPKVLVVTARPLGKHGLSERKDLSAEDMREEKILKSAHGIVKKPFDIPVLLSRIHQLMQ